jgi:predicted N-acetyltransferase YhbS
MLLVDPNWRGRQLGSRLLREGLERAGGLRLDIRTRTEGYYERFGASRSLGFSPHARAPRAQSHRFSCGEVKRAGGERSWIS